MILSATLLLCAQQFIGDWTFSGPHIDEVKIAGIEKIISAGNEVGDFERHQADTFYGHFAVNHDTGIQLDESYTYYQHKIVCDDEITLPLRMGSDDGIMVWLNGDILLEHSATRSNNPFAEHLILRLNKGENVLSIRIYNQGGDCSFSINPEQLIGRLAVDSTIRRGIAWLIANQMLDGSWGHLKKTYRNGATSLAIYTLLSCGVNPNSAAIKKGIRFLSATFPQKTYSSGCQLMALAKLNDPDYYDQMEVIASDLISWQEKNGLWAYPDKHWDLSTTQFALLGLRAAASVGIDIPKRVWKEAIDGILICGMPFDGITQPVIRGFSYYPGHPSSNTLSMTTAAVASLELCRQQLGGKYPQLSRKATQRASKEGLAWIEQNFTVARNFGYAPSYHYYTLYGIERVGALHDISKFGEHDWYNDGAGFLVAGQNANGAWPNTSASLPDTCFALLFLRRATGWAVVTGQNTSSNDSEVVSEKLDDRLQLHVNYGDPVVMWTSLPGSSTTESVTYAIKRDDNRPWQTVGQSSKNRFGFSYSFPSPGQWLVRAECLIKGEIVDSTDVKYWYVPKLRADDVSYGDDEFENLIPSRRPTVTASSESASYFGANQLIDGSLGTRWFCKSNDSRPEVVIKMRKSAKATKLLFSHIYTTPTNISDQPRPTEVEVFINNDNAPITIEINPDQSQKTIYVFDKKKSIKKLRVVITKITDGTLGASEVGFSEIELQR